MTPQRSRRLAAALALLAWALTVALYWPGLAGPLLFDDFWNLAPLERWIEGQQPLLLTILPNPDSALLSRPVAMASFALTTWLGGTGTFPLKLGNLVLHLACGGLAFLLLRRVLRLDPHLAQRATALAALLALVWLIHPLHVSTVLYAVQRMAQLATLFTLLAVLAWLHGRQLLAAGRTRPAWVLMFGGFPALVLLGVLSKQNAAVAPLLCLALELAYFQRRPTDRPLLGAFFGSFLLLPAVAMLTVLLLAPHRLLAGYVDLEFSVVERVLSQPRALLDYAGMWFIPRSARMGLYTDDFPVSTGLLDPATTLPALLFLLGASVLALRLRHRLPSVFAGWFFFLSAHSVEASFLPLEIYYEHRNYLPSIGLLLAVAGFAALGADIFASRPPGHRHLVLGLGISLFAALAFSTHARVLVWQSEDLMTRQGMRHHPGSIRVHLDRLGVGLRNRDGDDILRTLDAMENSTDPRMRLLGRLDRITIRCAAGEDVKPSDLIGVTREAPRVLGYNEVHAAQFHDDMVRQIGCSLPPSAFADLLVELLEAAADQPDTASVKTTIRRLAGQLYARDGNWAQAEEQARRGWEGQQTMQLGVLLAHAYYHNEKFDDARAQTRTLEARLRPFDALWRGEIELLHGLLDATAADEAPLRPSD